MTAPTPWDHPATGAALRALEERANWWTDYANRFGHHPYTGDALRQVSVALLHGRRLTPPQANHLRMALGSHDLADPVAVARCLELYDAARYGQLVQDEDGLLHAVDFYDLPPYV